MSSLRNHEYEHKFIVIGGSIEALLYSYLNNYPCIFIEPKPPFEFDEFLNAIELSLGGSKFTNKLDAWHFLLFNLSLAGLMPLSDKATSINIRDNQLRVTTTTSRLIRFNFDKLMIFDDSGVYGLPLIKKTKHGKYRIIDWFSVRSGMEHEHDLLETKDDFISKVIFYPSKRFGNQKSGRIRKDLVAISHLDKDKVNSFDNSDTMARFKITEMMKSAGIKGARNGRDANNPEIYRYYSPKIESVGRQVEPKIRNFYEKDKRFRFINKSPEEIYKKEKNKKSYVSKIAVLINKTN